MERSRDILAWHQRLLENPIVQYSSPWRRGLLLRLLFLILVGWALGALFFAVAVTLLHIEIDDSIPYILIPFTPLGAGILIPVLFLVFTPPWRKGTRIEELALTSMTGAEVGAGMIYWGINACAVFSVGYLLVYAGIAIGSTTTAANYAYLGYDDICSLVQTWLLAVAVMIFAIIRTVHTWMRNPGGIFRIIFRTFTGGIMVVLTLMALVYLPFPAILPEIRDDTSGWAVFAALLWALLAGGAYLAIHLRLGWARMGDYVFACIKPRDYIEAAPDALSAAMSSLPHEKRRIPWRFFRLIRGDLMREFLLHAGAVCAVLCLYFLLSRVPNLEPDLDYPFAISLSVAVAMAPIGVLVRSRRHGGRTPLIAGRLGLSVILPTVFTMLPYMLLAILSAFASLRYERGNHILVYTALIAFPSIIAIYVGSLPGVFLAAARRGRFRAVLLISGLGFLSAAYHSILMFLAERHSFQEVITVFFLSAGLVLLSFVDQIFERLHRLEAVGLPANALSLETEQIPNQEFLPDGYWKG